MSEDPRVGQDQEDQLISHCETNSLCKLGLHICNTSLHTPILEPPSLNALVQLIIYCHTYRDRLEEREERVCNRLLHMVASDNGREIIKYLSQQGCISNLEVYTSLGISRQAVMRHLDALESMGLLHVYATVENEVRIPAQFMGAKIRGWVGLPPEYSERAIQRYLAFFKKESLAKPQVETVVDWAAVNEWAVRAKDLLPVDLEGRLTPIYDAIREIGVPPELREKVKDRIVEMQARKVPGPVGVDGEEAR